MHPTSPLRKRFTALSAFVVFAVALLCMKGFFVSSAQKREVPVKNGGAQLVPAITATDAVTFAPGGDVDSDGKADPGDTLQYTVTVSNSGTDATGVQLNSTLQNITTLVGGSVALSPIAVNDSFNVLGNVSLSPAAGAGLLANDINPNGGALTITASPSTSAQGGNVTVNADGSFTYNPPPGYEGADSFSYTIGNGTGFTDTATVSLNVSGMIWFVNNGAASCTTLAGGCGRLSNPFSTLAAFQALNNGTGNNPAANDNIFIYESASAYTGGVTLLSGQKLVGQDSTSTLAAITGVTVPPNSAALPAMNAGGNATTIQNATAGGNGVTLGSGNTIRGFTAGTSANFAILGSGFGTLTAAEVIISTTGQGLSLTNGTAAGAGFTSVTSSGGTNNILLTSIGGTLALGGGGLSGAAGPAFSASQGTAVVTYSGTITKSATNQMISIANTTGGSYTLSGAITHTTLAVANNSIVLTSNAGAIGFSGGLTITSTSSAAAFLATENTGTISSTSGTISATGGPAVQITKTTGTTPLNMQLTSVSANGGTNGIILKNTAGTGFAVNGDGTGHANGSGGTIQNITGGALGNNPVWLTTASGTYSFKSMNMSITINAYSGMHVDNNAGGTATVNVTGCTFTGVGPGNSVQQKALLQFEAGNTGASAANLTANVQNSFFFNNRTYGMYATAAGDALMDVTLNQSGFGTDTNTGAPVNNPGTTITNAPPFSIGITNGSSAQVDYNVTNNTFWGARGADGAIYAVSISGAATTATSHLSGFFSNNRIGKTGVTGSGCSGNCAGLGLLPGTQGTFNASVLNNDIRQTNSIGINFVNTVGAGATNTSITHIKGNTLAEPDLSLVGGSPPLLQRAIAFSPSNSGGANVPSCAEIGDNTGLVPSEKNNISGGWQSGAFVRVTNIGNTPAMILPGLSPASGATAAQVNAFIQVHNTFGAPATGSDVAASLGPGINGGSPCAIPSLTSLAEKDGANAVNGVNDIGLLAPPARSPLALLESAEVLERHTDSGEMASIGSESNFEAAYSSTFVGKAANTFSEWSAKLAEMVVPTARAQDVKVVRTGKASPESGESITTAPTFTLPGGKSVKIVYRATVNDGPYAAGVNNITNDATISGSGFSDVLTNPASIALDAAPDLQVVASDGGATTQPAGTAVYTLNYQNVTSIRTQGATGAKLTINVPALTTFNSGLGTPGWSCANGSTPGTLCTFTIGALSAGGNGAVTYAVNVDENLGASNIQVAPTFNISDDGTNGTDLNGLDNMSNDTTNIVGVWTGATSTDWATNTNWSNNTSPPNGNNVTAVGAGGNSPSVTSADVTVGRLFLSGRTLTIGAGRNFHVTGNSAQINMNVVSGAGTFEVDAGTTLTRVSPGQIECAVKKNIAGPSAFVLPVGTSGGQYTPLDVTINSGAGSLTAKANTGVAPLAPIPLNSGTTLHRYWSLSGTGINANIVFQYLAGDVFGTEANYRVIRVSGGSSAVRYPNDASTFVTPASHTFTVNGLTTFSDWTAGEAVAPTAASVPVAGRVITPDGRGIGGSIVIMQDENGIARQALTNPFGYYSFPDVQAGRSYTLTVTNKQYLFSTSIITVQDELTNVDFIGVPRE